MRATSYIKENGFKVVLAEDHSNPLVCVQMFIRIGSAWEEENEAGFSHFLEHLVFKSTEKYPNNSVMEYITSLGGTINAYTEYDSTSFYITIPSKHLQKAIETIAELAQNANFDEKHFQNEKAVVIEELKQYNNDPEDFFIEEIAKHYFRVNPYKNPIIGNVKTLSHAQINDLYNFYRKYYRPQNSFMVITGDFDEGKTKQFIEQYFSDWLSTESISHTPVKGDFPQQPAVYSFPKKISNDMLAFVLPDVAEGMPEAHILALIIKAFAIGKNSRLSTRLFNKEKLIDGIKVHSLSGINDGCTMIEVLPKKNKDLDRIIYTFLEELKKLHQYGLSDQEIEDHKKELVFSYRYSFEFVDSITIGLGNEELISSFENYYNYPHIINSINEEDIDKVTDKYLTPEKLHVYHIGRKQIAENGALQAIKREITKPRAKSQYKEYHEQMLDNGLKVILKHVKGKQTIGMSLATRVSQLNEREHNRGINVISAGMMLYGNQKRNYEQFLKTCSSNGIQFAIIPKMETTNFKLRCFRETLELGLELLSDSVLEPTFSADYLDNLKQSYSSNIDRIRDFPPYYAVMLWKKMLFGSRSNMINKYGSKTALRNITRKKIRNWHKEQYVPNNMTLALVGDFDFDKALKLVEQYFISSEKNDGLSKQSAIIQPSSKKYKKVNIGNDQAIVTLGGFLDGYKEKEKITAFNVLSQYIGGDSDSLLYNELREKRGLAYSVDYDFSSIKDIGFFAANAIVDKDNQDLAIKLILDALDSVKENGISEKDLKKTKNYILGQRIIDEESMLSQADILATIEAVGFGIDHYKTRNERLMNVSIENIHQLAKSYFNRDELVIHVLS